MSNSIKELTNDASVAQYNLNKQTAERNINAIKNLAGTTNQINRKTRYNNLSNQVSNTQTLSVEYEIERQSLFGKTKLAISKNLTQKQIDEELRTINNALQKFWEDQKKLGKTPNSYKNEIEKTNNAQIIKGTDIKGQIDFYTQKLKKLEGLLNPPTPSGDNATNQVLTEDIKSKLELAIQQTTQVLGTLEEKKEPILDLKGEIAKKIIPATDITKRAVDVLKKVTSFDNIPSVPDAKVIFSEAVTKVAGGLITTDTVAQPAPLPKNKHEAPNIMKPKTSQTQLLQGDGLDLRKYEFIMPVFYEDQTPAFITIHNLDGGDENKKNTEEQEDNISGDFILDLNIQSQSLPEIKDNPFLGGSALYNQFLLTSITETHNEKFDIVDTMSEGQIFFAFGQRPEIWTFSGALINDRVNNWLGKFRVLWEDHIRASVLVARRKYIIITIPASQISVSCYPVGLTIFSSADTEVQPFFTMSAYIRAYKSVPVIHNSYFSGLVIKELNHLSGNDESKKKESISKASYDKIQIANTALNFFGSTA